MSTNAEKLEALLLRVTEYKNNLEIKNFLEAMGFFALVEFLEEAYKTGVAITANLEAHIGAMFKILDTMFNSRIKVTNLMRQVFTLAH